LEEADRAHAEAIERSPFGITPLAAKNYTVVLNALGKTDETRRLAPKMAGSRWAPENALLQAAFIDGNWTEADSLARVLRRRFEDEGGFLPEYGRFAGACVAVGRGKVEESIRVLRASEDVRTYMSVLDLADYLTAGSLTGERWAEEKSGMRELIVLGGECSILGDSLGAADVLSAISQQPEFLQKGYVTDIDLLKAHMAARGGDWDGVKRLLKPYVPVGVESYMGSQVRIRFLYARALAHLGELEDAREAYEWVIRGWGISRYYAAATRAYFVPLAHAHLVVLNRALGDEETASAHLQALNDIVPDPESAYHRLLSRSIHEL